MSGGQMTGILVLVMAASVLVPAFLKKRAFTGIYGALSSGDYDAFFRRLDSRAAMAFLPAFMRENLRLSAYLSMDDESKVTEQFNAMMKRSMTQAELSGLLMRGFDYFCKKGDGAKCARILEKMQEVLPAERLALYRRHYEIVFCGSDAYTGQLRAETEAHRGKMKGYLEYLLACALASNGQADEAAGLPDTRGKRQRNQRG